MKISIITISYNNCTELKYAIESVLSQSYSDIEYIIIDGLSSDGTQAMINFYGDHIDTFISEPDKGIYDALNKGVRLATGDLIGFLHSDDIYAHENVLKQVVDTASLVKSEALYGDLLYVNKQDTSIVTRHWKSGEYNKSLLKRGWMPPHPTLFLSPAIYEKARMPNGEYFDSSLSIAADYDFMMRILNKHDIKPTYLPEVLVKMRVGGASNRNLKAIINKSREDMLVMRRNGLNPWTTLFWKNLKIFKQKIKR